MPIQHIRCFPGATQGEEIAAEFIRDAFKNNDAVLLSNFHHPNGIGAGTDEIDLLLVNTRGVWLLETKHWYGAIRGDPSNWSKGGRRYKSPIRDIEMKARRVGTTVQELGFDNVSVAGLVVLTVPEPDCTLDLDDPLKDKVLRLNQSLVKAVTGDRFLFRSHNRRLTADDVKRIGQLLAAQKVDPKRRIVGSYRLLRELEADELYTVYEAQHTDVGRRARVKRYELTGLDKIPDLARAAKRFQQDMRALITVEGHSNVVRAYDFYPDPDTSIVYWLILEWVDGPTLRDLLDRAKFSYDQQLGIMLPLARALDYCHRKGIIHRNITPSSIYVARDATVKLGDFDFARVPAAGTISVQGQPLIRNDYTAPEIRDDASAADQRSDLYSLGVVWYDMALHRTPTDPVLLSTVKKAELSEPARELLGRLIAPRPDARPASAAEVVQLFQKLAI
jgi:tRNA A-37 threonylcarbamoyl transferase component Bud32